MFELPSAFYQGRGAAEPASLMNGHQMRLYTRPILSAVCFEP